MEQIYRLHYRAQLNKNYSEEELQAAITSCTEKIASLQKSGHILTAALYRHEQMLFLYYEALGQQLKVMEPIAMGDAPKDGSESFVLESGEDVQITAAHPTDFLCALAPFLSVWPGQKEDRLWVHMYHIYYHSVPENVESWCRNRRPEMRRGRIAFLRDDKLFSYIYYHKEIVDEGLLTGDRYQSIALHENILFSYFEEPKTVTNVKKVDEESKVIRDWLAVDPESHFIHMPQGEGENFMLLPALFAMGVEDLEN